jgi:hypothetical protein
MTVKQIEKILKTYDPQFKMTERKNVLRQVLSKFKSLSRYINEEAEISKIAKEMTESFKLLYSRTHNDKYLTYMRTLNECIISTMSFEDALDSLNASELKGSGADLINKAIPLYKNIKIDYDTFLKAVEFYDLNND